MKHSNIAFFVPHVGCPHTCSFCNQRSISGTTVLPTARDIEKGCRQALTEITDREHTEIAFFGGSFTAIPRDYMLSLLKAAEPVLPGRNVFGYPYFYPSRLYFPGNAGVVERAPCDCDRAWRTKFE